MNALEAVLVSVCGLTAPADEGAVVELPLIGLEDPTGERFTLRRGTLGAGADLFPQDRVDLWVGRSSRDDERLAGRVDVDPVLSDRPRDEGLPGVVARLHRG